MTVGDLFSGIGGFSLGLERTGGFKTNWFVEIDPYCQRVLRKHWPAVPCYGDIKAIDWTTIPPVDLVCGGFPCQPFSVAGKRAGQEDDRYLWPEVVRCLEVLKPTWFLGENVPGLIHLGLDQVLTDLEGLGYETQTLSIPACAVDAPHRRDRLWIVAYSNSGGLPGSSVCEKKSRRAKTISASETRQRGHVADSPRLQSGREEPRTIGQRTGECGESLDVADSAHVMLNGTGKARQGRRRESTNSRQWLPEPAVGELVDGVSGRLVRFEGRVTKGSTNRVNKLKALGNSIVPQIAEALGKMILESRTP